MSIQPPLQPLLSENIPKKDGNTLWKKSASSEPPPVTVLQPITRITNSLQCIPNNSGNCESAEEFGPKIEGFATTPSAATSSSQYTTPHSAKDDDSQNTTKDTINVKIPSAKLALRQAMTSIKNTLASPTTAVDTAGFWVASEVASLCVSSPAQKDVKIIQKQFERFLAVVISCYVVYNWYFMQFYHDGLLRISSFSLSPDALQSVSPILFLFFKYNVVPVWALNHFLLRIFPRIFGGILSQKAIMTLLFALVIGGINAFSERLYNSLVSSVMLKPDSLAGIYMFSMLAYAVYSLVSFDKSGMPGDAAAIAEKFYLMFQSPIMTAVMTTAFILRFLWSSIIVCTSALTVALYLIFMSMFAMVFYSDVSLVETISRINWYVERPRAEDACAPSCGDGPYSTAKSVACSYSARAIGVVYKYAFELAILICLAKGCRTYYSSSMDSNLKAGMIVICTFIALIVCGVIGARSLAAADDAAKELAYQKRLFESAEAILGYTTDKDHKYSADNFDAYAASVECDPCGKPKKSLFEWVAGLFSGSQLSTTSSIISGIRDNAAAAMGK